MKHLLALLLAVIALAGCATYSIEKLAEDGSTVMRADIKSLWHDVEALEAEYASGQGAKLNLKVGRMGSSNEVDQALCLLFPHLCQGDKQ